MDYKFVELKKATDGKHKFTAIFYNVNTKKFKKVHFGAKGYEDFTIHKDENRKRLYKIRHQNDRINDPLTPGALSMWILWNKETIQESLKDYLKHFNL